MRHPIRSLVAVGLTFAVSVLAGAGIAGAQEMEHGRTRPVTRELASNVLKKQDATANVYISYVGG